MASQTSQNASGAADRHFGGGLHEFNAMAVLDNASIDALDCVEMVNRSTLGERKFSFYKCNSIAQQIRDENADLVREINRVEIIQERLLVYVAKAERLGVCLK